MANPKPSPIERVVSAAGSGTALARSLGVTASAVSNWRRTGIPADRLPAIEAITGIPMKELRPDLWPAAKVPA